MSHALGQSAIAAGAGARAATASPPVALASPAQAAHWRSLYRCASAIASLVVVAAGLVATVLWAKVPGWLLLPWLFFLGASAAMLLALAAHYLHLDQLQSRRPGWGHAHLFMIAALAAGWGIGIALIGAHLSPAHAVALGGTTLLLVLLVQPLLPAATAATVTFTLAATAPITVLLGLHAEAAGLLALALAGALTLAGRHGAATLSRTRSRLAQADAATGWLLSADREKRMSIAALRTEHERLQSVLADERAAGARLVVTLRSIREAVVTVDGDGRIDFVNPVAEVLTGLAARDARGRPIIDVVDLVDGGTGLPVANPAIACLSGQPPAGAGEQLRLLRRDGVEYGVECTAAPLRDLDGTVSGAVLVLRDVTEKRALAERVAWQAGHDGLTGLLNRAEFERGLARLLAAPADGAGSHALCLLDIDRFQIVNDTAGPDVGDALLRRVAEALKRKVRDADLLARLGGDQFGLVLRGCPPDKARMIGESLRQCVAAGGFAWQGAQHAITASVAVVELLPGCSDLASALAAADATCVAAKERGGDLVQLYRAEDSDIARCAGAMQWLPRLRSALDQERFALSCRPLQPLASGDALRIGEIAALLVDADGALVPAGEYVPAGERYHLMPEIDRWVIKAAVDAVRLGHPTLKRLDLVTVPVSGQSVCDERVLQFVLELLDDDALPARNICFEMTATALAADIERTRRFVGAVQSRGARAALRDFGRDSGSFTLLKRARFDYLKLAGEFVQGMSACSADFEIVVALARVAHSLGMRTIGCGVSSSATLASLRSAGVDYVQGPWVGEPRPLQLAG